MARDRHGDTHEIICFSAPALMVLKVEDYFETFVGIYDEHFSRQYGFCRPYVEQVIYRYLDCGDLRNGFDYLKNSGYKR